MRRLLPLLLAACCVTSCADTLTRLRAASVAIPTEASGIDVPTDDRFGAALARLEALVVRDLGGTVTYGPLDPEVDGVGLTNSRSRAITVDMTLHGTARFETLTHEAAHLLAPPFLIPTDGEVFAEGVACVVDTDAGDRDAVRRSARYLAGGKTSLHVLQDYRVDILRAARRLEGR